MSTRQLWILGVGMILIAASLVALTLATSSPTVLKAQTGATPTCALSVNPANISSGGIATLAWSVTGADSMTIDQGIGTASPATAGFIAINPTTTQTYTAVVSGTYGSGTCSTTIAVDGTNTTTPVATTNGPVAPLITDNALTPTSGPVAPSATTISPATYALPGTTPAPMLIDARDDGTILIRGFVQGVTQDSVTLETWGGRWTIRAVNNTTAIPSGTLRANDLSGIVVGHFVGASGVVSQHEPNTVLAIFVRDWTTNPLLLPVSEETGSEPGPEVPGLPETGVESGAIDEAANMGAEATETYMGVADDVGFSSFTLRDMVTGADYTVTLADNGEVVDSSGESMSLFNIRGGDEVTVEGTLEENTITATNIAVRSQ